jgi:putative membrane protein
VISNFSDHGSNERTFLAGVRTSISIVGFGLSTARLGSDPAPLWSEISMLLSGGSVVIIAYLRMRHIHGLIRVEELLGDDKVPTDAFLIFLIAALFGVPPFS